MKKSSDPSDHNPPLAIELEEIPLIDTQGTSEQQPLKSSPNTPSPSTGRKLAYFISALSIGLSVWLAMSIHTLKINVLPKDAMIEVNKGFSLPLFDRFIVFSGNYVIHTRHVDYFPQEDTVEVHQSTIKDITLTPKPGPVFIESNAPRARVFIGDQSVGFTNETIENIEHGNHAIKIEDRFYENYEGELSVFGKVKLTTSTINLTPNWGDFSLTISPKDGEIWQDDAPIGVQTQDNAHYQFRLPKGLHRIFIKKEGFENYALALDVKPRSTVDLGTIKLKKAAQQIAVESMPDGAIVTINGQYKGITPLFFKKPHYTDTNSNDSFQLKLQKQGYREIVQMVNAETLSSDPLSFQLQPLLGKVVISANVNDASILINNIKKGKTKKSGNQFSLPSNPQTITLLKSGYKTETLNIRPVHGKTQRFNVKLLTQKEYQWAQTPKAYKAKAGNIAMKLFRPDVPFKMGSSRREQGRQPNEYERQVLLNRAFYVSQHEITNRQLRLFMPQYSSGNIGGKSLNLDAHPAANMAWLTAALYCNWLSQQENLTPFYHISDEKMIGYSGSNGYRLPTETEWAWLARYKEGKMARFSWGNNYPPKSFQAGNIADSSLTELLPEALRSYQDGYPYSAPIAKFTENHNGLFDIEGNVAEWIHDFYGVKTGLSTAVTENPLGPESGDFHVIRGPSWKSGGLSRLRLSYRDSGRDGRNDVGFRIARYLKAIPPSPSTIETAQTHSTTSD